MSAGVKPKVMARFNLNMKSILLFASPNLLRMLSLPVRHSLGIEPGANTRQK